MKEPSPCTDTEGPGGTARDSSRGHDAIHDDLQLPPQGASVHAHGPEQVAGFLRQMISEGQILPGTKLAEVRLAARLEVSRNTLRSAFQILADEGLVERQPNRGVFVHTPDAEDVRQMYRTRRIIEVGIIRTIDFARVDTSGVESAVDLGEQALSRSDEPGMAQANQQFHREIVILGGSEALEALMDQILAQMRLIFFVRESSSSFHGQYVAGNLELSQLLIPGHEDAAESFLVDYLVRAERQLLDHLESGDGPPSGFMF